MPEERPLIITLLTDFGTDDPWVGAMKGVLWTLQPTCKIIDITHAVPAHDIFAGAFTLYRTYRDYPPWTINVSVVDPGVGGTRRPIIVVTQDRYFIGPDNGLFSFIYRFDVVSRVVAVEAKHFFRHPLSQTFHGRDVFAPIAGWLARGIPSSRFGPPITDYKTLEVPVDAVAEDGSLSGEVCGVDRFGNILTNIRRATLGRLAGRTGAKGFKVFVAGREIPVIEGGYDQAQTLFALFNASGLLEVAAKARSAAALLGITKRGEAVRVVAS